MDYGFTGISNHGSRFGIKVVIPGFEPRPLVLETSTLSTAPPTITHLIEVIITLRLIRTNEKRV